MQIHWFYLEKPCNSKWTNKCLESLYSGCFLFVFVFTFLTVEDLWRETCLHEQTRMNEKPHVRNILKIKFEILVFNRIWTATTDTHRKYATTSSMYTHARARIFLINLFYTCILCKNHLWSLWFSPKYTEYRMMKDIKCLSIWNTRCVAHVLLCSK